jgi:hypothetical protein
MDPCSYAHPALHARLSALTATALWETCCQNGPDAGLLILRDGEPVEPEVTLLPTPPPKA